MRRLAFVALSLAFLATACQPATTELTEEQKAAIAAEVNAINAELLDAMNEVDADRVMSYYLNSPELVEAFAGHLVVGFAALDDLAQRVFAMVASQAITVTESRTTVLAPDVVCVVLQMTGTFTDTSGVTVPEIAGASTLIWVRRNGEWKVHFAHSSTSAPEAP